MSTGPSFCDQCGARLSVGVRFCEACGAPVIGVSGAASSLPQAASKPAAPALPRTPARTEPGQGTGHGLRWAAPIALCSAAVAGWLWLQSREPSAPSNAPVAPVVLPEPTPATTEAAEPAAVAAAPERVERPVVFPVESMDGAAPADDPIAAEYQTIKARHERAYRAYTILITEGGSGNVIEARDEYAAAYEELKRFQAAHPEYAQ